VVEIVGDGETVMRWTRRMAAVGMSIGVLAASGTASASVAKQILPARPTAEVRTGHARDVFGAADRPDLVDHYSVVTSALLTAENGEQSFGAATCPAATVVYGGGVLVTSDSLAANVNSSWPENDGEWAADVNNASGSATTFQVYAVCAKEPHQYSIVESSMFPTDNTWYDDENNDSSGSASLFPYVICENT
jgi:hypothetical protein